MFPCASKSAAAVFVALLFTTGACAQQVVVKNLNTGHDNATGSLIPNGAPDPNYSVVLGGSSGASAQPTFTRVSPIPPTWLQDNASTVSRWIVLAGSGEWCRSAARGEG
jgi:hypothetical protein